MRPLGSDTHKMEKENYSFDIKGFANSDAYMFICVCCCFVEIAIHSSRFYFANVRHRKNPIFAYSQSTFVTANFTCVVHVVCMPAI